MQRDLVLSAQVGDVDAYSTLTAGMTDRLFAAARLILGDSDQAADAVQDALLQAWLDLRSLRDPERFEAWMHRVLVRTCYAAARRNRKRTVVEIHMSQMVEPSQTDSQASIALHDQLNRAFTRLSTDHRTVLALVHYLGLTMTETASVIGVPLGTVQSRLSRATQLMRAALEADERRLAPVVEGVR
jgi:RNA polymerase sigma-70 factor (ECF subfamily)